MTPVARVSSLKRAGDNTESSSSGAINRRASAVTLSKLSEAKSEEAHVRVSTDSVLWRQLVR